MRKAIAVVLVLAALFLGLLAWTNAGGRFQDGYFEFRELFMDSEARLYSLGAIVFGAIGVGLFFERNKKQS